MTRTRTRTQADAHIDIAPSDLEAALLELGVTIVRSTDDEVIGKCPAHMENTGKEDRNPSWSVNRERGWHNCFSCSFSGSFVHLVMYLKFNNDAFKAYRWIRKFGLDLDRVYDLPGLREVDVVEEPVISDAVLYESMEEPPTWVLEKRGISLEAARFYGIKWNSGPTRLTPTESVYALEDSWILPIRRFDGDLVGWQTKGQDSGLVKNYPLGVKKANHLFGLNVFPVGAPALVVESPLDVAHFYTCGWTGGLGTYGSHFSGAQMRLVREVTDEMIAAFDNPDIDHAGLEACSELAWGRWKNGRRSEPAWAQLINTRFFNYRSANPGEKDIGTMDKSEIRRGLYEAQHLALTDFPQPKGMKKSTTPRGKTRRRTVSRSTR